MKYVAEYVLEHRAGQTATRETQSELKSLKMVGKDKTEKEFTRGENAGQGNEGPRNRRKTKKGDKILFVIRQPKLPTVPIM